MRMKSVSALFLILGGFSLIAFETSFYGAAPVAAAPQAKASTQIASARPKAVDSPRRYGTMMREGSG
ncbi:MAG: hypothetical protein WCC76_14765 [Candidatus Acidiferrales bacterium]|jgi:hypothetical protein